MLSQNVNLIGSSCLILVLTSYLIFDQLFIKHISRQHNERTLELMRSRLPHEWLILLGDMHVNYRIFIKGSHILHSNYLLHIQAREKNSDPSFGNRYCHSSMGIEHFEDLDTRPETFYGGRAGFI